MIQSLLSPSSSRNLNIINIIQKAIERQVFCPGEPVPKMLATSLPFPEHLPSRKFLKSLPLFDRRNDPSWCRKRLRPDTSKHVARIVLTRAHYEYILQRFSSARFSSILGAREEQESSLMRGEGRMCTACSDERNSSEGKKRKEESTKEASRRRRRRRDFVFSSGFLPFSFFFFFFPF